MLESGRADRIDTGAIRRPCTRSLGGLRGAVPHPLEGTMRNATPNELRMQDLHEDLDTVDDAGTRPAISLRCRPH